MFRFLAYNNAVPIALSFMTLSFGAAFAASEDVRDSVYSSQTQVVSVDNTYIANKDLSSWTPTIEITGVTEDEENYYVAYVLTSIDIVDSIWQDIARAETMKVSKQALGNDIDLGIYTTEQLKQLASSEVRRLRETQEYERRLVSTKVVATEYSGLVGRFLDTSTETLPGYTPTITPPSQNGQTVASPQMGSVAGASAVSNSAPPRIQILGPNPQQIPLGANFADLGAVATDDSGYVPILKKFVDGTEVLGDLVTVDTSVPREFLIRYEATDSDGLTSSAERRVIVGTPLLPPTTQAESNTQNEPLIDAESPTQNNSQIPDTGGASTSPVN